MIANTFKRCIPIFKRNKIARKNTSIEHLILKNNHLFCNIRRIYPKTFYNLFYTNSRLYNDDNFEINESNVNQIDTKIISDAKKLIDEGNESKAIALLREYINNIKQMGPSLHKELSSAYSLLSIAYTKQKEIDLAIESIDNKISVDPLNREGYLEKSNLHFLKGDFSGSVNSLARASQLNPNDPVPYYQMASQLYVLKKFDHALKNAIIAHKLDDKHYESIVLISMILRLVGSKDYKEFFNKADKLQPKNHYHYCKMARIEYEMNNYESAMEYIEKAYELNPEATETNYLAAIALLDNEDIESGKKLLLKALSINPDHVDSLVEIAKVYISEKKFDKIDKISEKLIFLAPTNPAGYYFKACYLYQESKNDEAIDQLKKCILLNPSYLMPYTLLTNILRNEERYEEAMSICNSGLKLDPENSHLLMEKGYLLIAEEKYEEAAEIFEKLRDAENQDKKEEKGKEN